MKAFNIADDCDEIVYELFYDRHKDWKIILVLQ